MIPTTSRLSRRRLSAEGRLPVVGESHYRPALHRLANGVDVATDTGAVTVGYLGRYDAPAYQAALLALKNEGYAGTCPGRITGGGRHRPTACTCISQERTRYCLRTS